MNRDTGAGARDDDRWAEDGGAPWDDRTTRARDRADRDGPADGAPSTTPVRVALAIAAVGSVVFLVLAILARSIPVLASAAAVLGIVFVALAVAGGRATYRAATAGENGRAFALAVGGGLAAMIGLGALAMAIDLALIWGR